MKNDNEVTAGSLLATSGAYWEGFALQAGVVLGLFDALGEGSRSAGEVAAAIDGDERATTALLGALAAMGLTRRDGERWANSEAARRYLLSSSAENVISMIRHHFHLVDAWHRLDEAVRAGSPVRARTSTTPSESQREAFLMGMFNSAMQIAPDLAKELDLSSRRRLLDLGGGPGTWAIQLCLANPELEATVLDLPTTRPFAERTIERFDVADRVTFRAGDFTVGDFGGPYDVAWLSHILHSEGPDVCRDVIGHTVKSLEPGGALYVHEFILDDDLCGPLRPALFSLNMLVGTAAGQSYSEAQLTAMLEEAGARDVRRLPFTGPMQSGLLVATT